ncbi:MAG: ATP-dependent metallopeptidase FtsH/Yme1/Tma family protein, partial [Aquabacterium sp.]|uniref:ATP-dependent zinc metalloprotease FtsH n=1 Tax=Aquabacterium sp. TaxID=1872578 RepID=UPI001212284F
MSPWGMALILLTMLWVRDLWVNNAQVQPMPYSEFVQHLEAGDVASVRVASNVIEGELKKPLPDGRQRFITTRIEPGLAKDLSSYKVRYEGVIENTVVHDVLSWVLPVLLMFGLWNLLARKMMKDGGFGGGIGGMMGVGKSRARVYAETDVSVHFNDVAGVDEAKDELRESVDFLKNPQSYGRLGARMPKGILLIGPPGTGKTMLARAMAGEAGVPFFSISGSEFVEMFVGVGAARVRDLFEQARKAAPAIIFIDELDALGRARGAGPMSGGHDEKEQTLDQLLSEMDGFDASVGVVILAATNRPEVLDPALLRAGRFDRQVLVDRPDRKGRTDILRVHIKKITTAPDVNPDAVAALTPGFAGADLANLVNEAALLATRRQAQAVEATDFNNAIERIVAGLEKRNRVLSPKERQTVAYHEMGHALLAMSLPGADPVHKISIIPRGIGALGYTIQRPTEDRFLSTRSELANRMTVLLGGRAAEQLMLGEISSGAADDLAKATDIALDMVTRLGMSTELGQVAYERQRTPFLAQMPAFGSERNYSEDTARHIDEAVRQLVDKAFANAMEGLQARRDLLEQGA